MQSKSDMMQQNAQKADNVVFNMFWYYKVKIT